MGVILGAIGEKNVKRKRTTFEVMTTDQFYQWLCENNSWLQGWDICQSTTATTQTSTDSSTTTTDYVDYIGASSSTSSTFELESSSTTQSSTSSSDSSSSDSSSTTLSASALQRAHWCRFTNGSYLPLGSTFMYTECSLCQCTQSHAIRCANLQCMTTYCIDNSTPYRRTGQCCTQCAYDTNSNACVVNGVTLPHGTIINTATNKMLCWCQLGSVECRKYTGSIFSGMDLWGEGSAVYVIVAIICILLVLGTVLCCGCALLYYYYYRRAQQQSYEQYWNNAGWQPMGEEEQVADASAAEKETEAQQNEFPSEEITGFTPEYIPPPYALYNGVYVSEEQQEKDPKYM